MVDAVKKAGVANTVWYNYRRLPAVTLAKQLVDSGKLGKIFHYRANFLQDWTISADLPQGGTGLWRMDVEAAGSGVTGDLLAHCIDTAMWLNGAIKDVSAVTETLSSNGCISSQVKFSLLVSMMRVFSIVILRMDLWVFLNLPDMHADIKHCTPLKSMANMPPSVGTCTT